MVLSDNQASVLLSMLKNQNNPQATMDDIKEDAKEIMEFLCFDLEVIRFDQDERLNSKYLGKSE